MVLKYFLPLALKLETGLSSIIIVFISVIMRLVIFLLLVLPLFGRVIHCLAMMYPYTISRYEITIYSRKAAISTPLPPLPTGQYITHHRTGALHGID